LLILRNPVTRASLAGTDALGIRVATLIFGAMQVPGGAARRLAGTLLRKTEGAFDVHLDLEIEPGSDPIAGRVAGQSFVGWAGLAALLTTILDAAEPDLEESPRGSRADRT
jgi:hypothetical protein